MTSSANNRGFSRMGVDPTVSGLVDGTDFPHSALFHALNIATQGNYAIIEGNDFDITQRIARGATTGTADLRGDGEFLMKIRRFIPDFISQTGNAQVTLELRNFPNDTKASSALGPFTVTSSTQKVDTRARARAVSLKVANTGASQTWKLGTFRLDIQPDGRR